MKSNLWLSVSLHLLVIAATTLSSPFSVTRDNDFDEVIRVTAVLPEALPTPEPIKPLEIPEAIADIVDDDPEIEINDLTTKPAVKIDKPKPEPKPKKEEAKKPAKQVAETEESSDAQEPEESETEVEEASGGQFAGATIDNASFDYPIWFRQAFVKIARNFRHGTMSDGSLVCTIYFQVLASGRVSGLSVEESSGFSAFDDACMEAVSRSAPFPPLPRDFRDEIIGITIPFTNR